MITQPKREIEEMQVRRIFLYEQLVFAKEEYARWHSGVI